MAQKLIVEGENDIHVISHLCLKKGISGIVGFEDETEYKNKFVSVAGGKSKVKQSLKLILKKKDSALKNIGIVLDADSETENPAVDTWLSIRNILSSFGYENLPETPNVLGTIVSQNGKPKVGIWIMPNNLEGGYLEHFFQSILIENEEMWTESHEKIEALVNTNRNRFSEIAKQKAKVHTWLAWQQKPELAMGLALKEYNDSFDFNSQNVQNFFDWFTNTFDVNLKEVQVS